MIRLESFAKFDFNKLISWVDSEEDLVQFAGPIFNFPLTTQQLEKYLGDKCRFAFKVIEADPGQTIGHCEIYLTEEMAKLCRILIGEKSFRGKGFGLQIVNDLLDFSFAHFDKPFIELNVYDLNAGAIKCYEKAGFSINKDKISHIEVKGTIWNSLNMIIDKPTLDKLKSKQG